MEFREDFFHNKVSFLQHVFIMPHKTTLLYRISFMVYFVIADPTKLPSRNHPGAIG